MLSAAPAQLDSSRPDRRPFEGELAATTLWPENEKVFGHGYEVTMHIYLFKYVVLNNILSDQSITIASSNSHDLLATACRATSAQHAVVRVYSTSTYQSFGSPLEGHSLTVTRIAFSPDDRYIVTVSRDRTWRSFEKRDDGMCPCQATLIIVHDPSSAGYFPVAADKSHTRIVWDCAWSREGDIFATASRDKTVRASLLGGGHALIDASFKVKIWSPKAGSDRWPALATLKFTEAATAVAFCTLDTTR